MIRTLSLFIKCVILGVVFIDLSNIFIDSCGLQYLSHGSKSYIYPRLITNPYLDELLLLSEININALKQYFSKMMRFLKLCMFFLWLISVLLGI